MKIGVDASCWANRRGYGRYTRELLRTLVAVDTRNEYLLFLDGETARVATDLPDGAEQVVVDTSRAAAEAASASGRRSIGDIWAMRRAVRHHGHDLDLFYFPSVYTFFPISTSAKVIVTIHDTTAERYPRLIFPNWRSRLFWSIKLRMALSRADVIATVSNTSRAAITRQFGVPPDRIAVVPDAVGAGFVPQGEDFRPRGVLSRYGVNGGAPFVLYVGGISPHKNLDTLLTAHASLVKQTGAEGVRLVLVGDYEQDVFYSCYADLCRRTEALGTTEQVVFTGFVEDADLIALYHAATALVMPSYDEGFGLPALEAMACGTPVVASRAGSLPEVVGESGVFFDPNRPEELARALHTLLEDERARERMRRAGIARATEFSWERSAEAALEVFELAVNGNERRSPEPRASSESEAGTVRQYR